MSNRDLHGTWIEGETHFGEGHVLMNSNAETLIWAPLKSGQWEFLGQMRAYGPIQVGKQMSFTPMSSREGIIATKLTDAREDGEYIVLKTSEGLTLRLQPLDPVEHETPKTTNIGRMIHVVRTMLKL